MNTEIIKNLPNAVQAHIISTLKAYDEIFVTYENGEYHYGLCLKSSYAPDHKVIGRFKAEDIYTEEERIENYINEFKSYPANYKGKRDYTIIKKMENERTFNKNDSTLTYWTGKLVNGDFELTKQITVNV